MFIYFEPKMWERQESGAASENLNSPKICLPQDLQLLIKINMEAACPTKVSLPTCKMWGPTVFLIGV